MNKQPNPDRALFHFILRAQQIAQQDGRSEKGYAMLMVSMISIALFSMLAAYMTMTNLNKSSTSAYVDGTNTFYVAESGLNRRAQQLRDKFLNYSLPSGLSPGTTAASQYVSPTNITNCFTIAANIAASATNDFECRNFAYNHTDSSKATVKKDNDGTAQAVSTNQQVGYNTYTFVADKTIYTDTARTTPSSITIPASQAYGGLNAMEYWYTVYSTAAKPDPLNPTNPVQQSNAKTVLQMDFRSRVVPLFQFAVFYDGDLEMNSSSNMTIGGRVHTNANLYVQPYTTDTSITTTFLGPVTAVGNIYNRVDASDKDTTNVHNNSTRVLMTGTDCGTGTCSWWPNYAVGTKIPLTSTQLAAYGSKVKSGAYDTATRRLDTPPPGFLRKRNYDKSASANASTRKDAIGEYFAKADMRLEMVPDRDVTSKAATPWTRDLTRIPFNFTSVTTVTGAASTCTTTVPARDTSTTGLPTLASDPAATYIDPDRNNPTPANAITTTLHCNVFTKGQLQSLRQPVMVLTSIKQTAALSPTENTILSGSATLSLPTAPTVNATVNASITAGTAPNPTQQAILRALQVAIASQPSPVKLDSLNQPFSSNTAIQTEFARLLATLPPTTLSTTDANKLTANTVTPNQVAAIGRAWFMPAPIQRIEASNVVDSANNLSSSGFYDGRERRWITMLQTNIASLSVWNRDGLYVESADRATDTTVVASYLANNTTKDAAFNAGAGANSTDGLAFDRAAASVFTTPRGLQSLGLGSNDQTEGGLVLHATVSDDLNGDGTIAAADDVTLDIANPIVKRDAVGNLVDANNNSMASPGLTIDYPRKYRGSALRSSPFGFAFNGANYLPGPLTLVTDQAIYTQGDFNNNGATSPAAALNTPDPNRLPASVVGDTITILSNQCLSLSSTNASTVVGVNTRYNDLLVPMGQISCGIPNTADSTITTELPGAEASNGTSAGGRYYDVTSPTAVNAAFLSNTERSTGNLPSAALATAGNASRGYGGTSQFSGALNNYIRMLEDWGGSTGWYFNYYGSFVSLGTPLEYSGNYFGGGTYYMIPRRNFNFDTNFNTFTSLPPLPPRAIYLKQDVFKRTYN
jgi:hypothetical protein